jgi:AcrR family transcriptional regulator
MIIEAAIGFFAELGFDAQLRELAKRLGISQALIFRYFSSKQALVERVYERVYVARWSAAWKAGLQDRSVPLQERLVAFYRSYLDAVEGYEWIRLALYSGLAGNDLTRRYIETRVDGLLRVIGEELRNEMPGLAHLTDAELQELVWHLHSTFIYYLIRKYVFQVAVTSNLETMISTMVTHFICGLAAQSNPAAHTANAGPERRHGKRGSRGAGQA